MRKLLNRLIEKDGRTIILLYGEIGEEANVKPSEIVEEIILAKNNGTPLEIRLNSIGGDVYGGISIINAIKQNKNNTTIFVDGVAASIAGVIALCGVPVYMSKYSKLMLHRVSGGCFGNVEEMQKCIEEMQSCENDLCNIISAKMGKTPEEIRTLYFNGKDNWLTSSECKQLGLIDGVFETEEVNNNYGEDPVQLYNRLNNKKGFFNFTTFKQRLNDVLKLKNADENSILKAIEKIKNNAVSSDISNLIESAVKRNLISPEDKEFYFTMAKVDKQLLFNRFEELKRNNKAQCIEIINCAIQKFKILPVEKETYLEIGYEMGANVLKNILERKMKLPRATDVYKKAYKDYTLDDWRTLAPEKLKEHPEIINILSSDNNGKTLDWYRKNNPVFLAENPEIFKRLLDQEKD